MNAESGTTAMRFAIVGAGVIGTIHARLISSLSDRAKLVAVVDVDVPRAVSLASTCGAAAYADVTSACAAEDIDAIAVCVPSAWHGDIAVEGLRAGKDVLIEKPLSTTLEDADRIIAAEKDSGRTVGVISQRRFQPPAVLMKEAIDAGLLGRITSGVAESALFRLQSYYDSGDWRGTLSIDGGGALMNQGIHTLDLLLWMMGTPAKVTAHTAQLAHERIEVEDVAAATIEFESGALGVLLASTAAYPGLPVRLTIHGDQGVAGMQGDHLHIFESALAGERVADPGREEEDEDELAGWNPTDIAHRAQYADFVEAVISRRPPKVTTSDGRLSLATVLAVYESARTGAPAGLNGVHV